MLVLPLAFASPQPAHALIRGGEGNSPVRDPGWPAGAVAVFNTPARVAWWEGPPYGGGQWHGECRGDAAAFNEVLKAFAAIDAPKKRILVHDGVGHSFWLNPNRQPEKEAAARIDWVFAVWQADRWQGLRRLPADLRPRDGDPGDDGPVPQIDVYAGGNIKWSDVNVPDGIEVVDERLEAHGFTPADGRVLEGHVVDLRTNAPLAARMRLELVEPQPKGGYRYTTAASATADANGRWVLKSAPAGWHRIVVEADGYVPRVIGYDRSDGQPRWSAHHTGLSKPARVAGRVTDAEGRPLADVEVRLRDVVTETNERYESPSGYTLRTDGDGRFQSEQVPIGKVNIWVHKPGYCRPGLGLPIEMPADDVALSMLRAATLIVTVDFDGVDLEGGYIVNVTPEKGAVVGSWGGSGNIDDKGTRTFENVPPGRYVVTGRPNPGNDSQATDPTTVELLEGESVEVILKAK
ncbi:MAG TPA: carboxypeptidase-like regulatory domain-containing protein [Planctomycetaceae bacterium]|nr:carboxypeptidase-like regulatory domain-containing protein [Planctomycetaceae bacterium]